MIERSEIMSDAETWRQDKSQKASALANDILALARRARAARFDTSAYILELAAAEVAKEIENGQAEDAKG